MKHIVKRLLGLGAVVVTAHAFAQPSLSSSLSLVVYPSGGQAPAQQTKDEGECYQWARQTTGVDPANPMAGVEQQQAAATPGQGVAAGGGALKGATMGALIGNLADEDAGEYALAGAAIGSIRGARKANQRGVEAQNQAATRNQATAEQRVQLFKNAFGACMEGRKYTVK
ncbi:MAG TPA: hypothetical protein VFO94_15635 [Gammaproteobacteria bacterium]|nr:hypothetical protein [Gammaproteobacteria bacterium]